MKDVRNRTIRWAGSSIALVVILFLAWAFYRLLRTKQEAAQYDLTKLEMDSVVNWALPFLGAMFAIGFLTMALIQVVKGVLPVRGILQRVWVGKWLERCGKGKTFKEMLKLAGARGKYRFFDLPIEQVCGQISSVVELVLDEPNVHKTLLYALAGEHGESDVKSLVGGIGEESNKKKQLSSDDPSRGILRNRVAHHIQRNIDHLQIEVGFKWKLRMRVTAILIGLGIGFAGVKAFSLGATADGWAKTIFVISSGLLGGYLSSVARDLVALVERGRR